MKISISVNEPRSSTGHGTGRIYKYHAAFLKKRNIELLIAISINSILLTQLTVLCWRDSKKYLVIQFIYKTIALIHSVCNYCSSNCWMHSQYFSESVYCHNRISLIKYLFSLIFFSFEKKSVLILALNVFWIISDSWGYQHTRLYR